MTNERLGKPRKPRKFITHDTAQTSFDGCDPETCQNKEHWFYEGDCDATKLDPTPTLSAGTIIIIIIRESRYTALTF